MTTVSFRNTVILTGIVTLAHPSDNGPGWVADITLDPALTADPDVMLLPIDEPGSSEAARPVGLSWQPGEPGRIRIFRTETGSPAVPCCCYYVIVSERA